MLGPLTKTQQNLLLMNKHFVIASKRICSHSPVNCRQLAENWSRALLFLQSTPEIAFSDWRKNNPVIVKNYMGSKLVFDTQDLYYEVTKIHDQSVQCQCINSLIIRSNNGVTAENSIEQLLV